MTTYRMRYAEWGAGEALAAARGMVEKPERAVERLEAAARAALAGRAVHAVNSGRTALALILEALRRRMPGRAEVVTPAYICPSVPETVVACGLTPRYADVDDTLNLTEAAAAACLGPDTLALLAVHMYGCPAPVAALEDLCRAHGVPLIDDAAQVMGVSQCGRPLGSFGAAGLVSFAQSKTVVSGLSGAGGLLVVSDDLNEFIGPLAEALPRRGKGAAAWLRFVWRHLFEGLSERSLHLASRLGFGEEEDGAVVPARIAPVPATVALRQLARVPEILDGKRAVMAAYADALAGHPRMRLPQYAEGRYLTRAMMLLPDGAHPASLRERLKASGVRTRLPYPQQPDLPDGVCPRMLSLRPRLIELPSPIGLGQTAASEILDRLQSALVRG